MKLRTVCIQLFLLLFFSSASGQNIISPLTGGVYSFLEAMSVKGLITQNEFSVPLTRNEIAGYLKTLQEKESELSSVERETLRWHLLEYHAELCRAKGEHLSPTGPAFFRGNDEDRPRLFYYRGTEMQLSVSPILGMTAEQKFDEFRWRFRNGFSVFGSAGNNFGFHVDFRDNTVHFKEHSDLPAFYEAETGPIPLKQSATRYEHSETHGSFVYSNDWLILGGIKENIRLGGGYSSNIILSSKAPTFPSIFLKIKPVKWLQFYYMHGWLLSRVHDSAASYASQIAGRPRNIDRPKYFAMHALQLNPWENLAYTVGETIVYSDQSPYWGYLMPFLFYRSVDHMFEGSTGENTGNNGSFFFDIKYWPVKKFQCFTTVFIDELSLTNLLNDNTGRNQLAFTLGGAAYDFGIAGLLLKAEYTRIQPWVYSNFVQTQTYTNSGYLMGHYIGQNSDQIFLSASYSILHNLKAEARYSRTRQGAFGPVKDQYDEIGEAFLYGPNRKETIIGLSAEYEYMHELVLKAYVDFTTVTDDDATRTPAWRSGNFSNAGISFSYGL